jgi:tetratricopeptide (TPR) repeat protein
MATKVSSTMSNPMLIANSELAACEFYARNGNDRAVGLCSSAKSRCEEAGVPDLAARATIAGARAAHLRGDLQNAREGYVAAVAALETRIYTDSDRKDLATQYVNLCTIEYQLESKGALTRCRDAIKALEAVQNRNKDLEGMLGAANLTAGAAAYKLDNAKDAEKHFKAGVTLLEKVGDLERASDAYLRLGRLQYRLKNEAASQSFERAIELSRNQPALAQTTTQARVQYTQFLMDREKWELAQAQLRPALMAAETAKEFGTLAWIYSAQAQVELKLGNRDGAIAALKSGVIAAKSAGDKDMEKSLKDNLAKFEK